MHIDKKNLWISMKNAEDENMWSGQVSREIWFGFDRSMM